MFFSHTRTHTFNLFKFFKLWYTSKQTQKKGQRWIEMYNNAKYENIYQCYVNPSQNKRIAEMNCRAWMIDSKGYDFRILGYNQMVFTCGWKTPAGVLRVETAYNSYLIY